jgi:hypothetical protein
MIGAVKAMVKLVMPVISAAAKSILKALGPVGTDGPLEGIDLSIRTVQRSRRNQFILPA